MATEEQLVERLRSGDTEALGEFIDLRRKPLLAYIQRQISDGLRRKVGVEDLLQEVAADACRSLGSVDLAERDPFGWLCQIAQRRIIDAHRKFFGAKKRDAAREVSINAPGSGGDSDGRQGMVDLLVASMTTASQAFSRDQRELKLLEALAALPEEQRDALRMRYVDGLPSKEIAARLGKSDGAVRVMLTRSLGKLQELLGPEAEPR